MFITTGEKSRFYSFSYLSVSDDEGRRFFRITGKFLPDHTSEKTAKLIVDVVRTSNLSQKIFVLLFSVMDPTLDSWDFGILSLRLLTRSIFPTACYSKYNRKFRETSSFRPTIGERLLYMRRAE